MSSAAGGATRDAFGEILVELGAKVPNMVVLDCDLEGSTRTAAFIKKFPERHLQFGIAESNMLGVATGLALEGKIPVCTSFGAFIAGRAETIRCSVAYNRSNVKMVGTHSGLGIGPDGGSQMSLEDVGYMRSISHVTVVQPADREETRQTVAWMLANQGPVYLRLTRQDVPAVHDASYKFQPGKIDVIHKTAGKTHFQAAVFASGGTVGEALEAARSLEPRGFAIKVINVHTLKPLDELGIAEALEDCDRAVSVEDHNVLGGLGSAVAEAMASAGLAKPLVRLGVKDFGESGSPKDLYEKYGISAPHVAEACLQTLP
jgi:transketolase